MVFSSILFLLYFLPVFMLVYVLLPQKAKNYWALLVSILFYAWGAPSFLYVVLSTSIIDFYLVQALYKSEQQQRKKLFLTISVLLNLGLLAYFKYANFFIENVNAALGSIGIDQLAWTQVALPIGISFFTFQTLTYAIEVYRNEHAPFERPDHYLLYKLIFPHALQVQLSVLKALPLKWSVEQKPQMTASLACFALVWVWPKRYLLPMCWPSKPIYTWAVTSKH